MGAFDGTSQEIIEEFRRKMRALLRVGKFAISNIIRDAQKIAKNIRSAEDPTQACHDVMDKAKKECIQSLTEARDKGYLSEEQFNQCRSDVINMSKYNSIDGCAVKAASLNAIRDQTRGLIKDADRGAARTDDFNKLPDITKEFSETLTNARIPDGILESPELAQKRIRKAQKDISRLSHAKQGTLFGRRGVGQILSDANEKAKAQATARSTPQPTKGDGAR